MTELEELKQRRELVVLAAELQRANVMRRIERLQASPGRRLLGFAALAAAAARKPAMLTLGTAAAKFALRLWRKRSARRPIHH